MSDRGIERALFWCYAIITVSSALCCIISQIIWSRWRYVLGIHWEAPCSETFYCHVATIGLLIPLFYAMALASYHGFRVYIHGDQHKLSSASLPPPGVCDSKPMLNGICPGCWFTFTVISSVMSVYCFVCPWIISAAFRDICRQYRDNLLAEFQGHKKLAHVIGQHLSCEAVFEFMDTLILRTSEQRRHYDHISAGNYIWMTYVCASITVIAWLFTCVLNNTQLGRMRVVAAAQDIESAVAESHQAYS